MTQIQNKTKVSVKVNGQKLEKEVFAAQRLLDFLREEIQLTGTKEGCGEGECGACSVLMDGEIVNSCLVPMFQAQGKDIETVEGLAQDTKLNPVQSSFLKYGGAQCGICTPGMIMASVALLRENPNPTEEDIKYGLSGNFCRCTGYIKIFDSVKQVKEEGGTV